MCAVHEWWIGILLSGHFPETLQKAVQATLIQGTNGLGEVAKYRWVGQIQLLRLIL
jgi:hypothetical protein